SGVVYCARHEPLDVEVEVDRDHAGRDVERFHPAVVDVVRGLRRHPPEHEHHPGAGLRRLESHGYQRTLVGSSSGLPQVTTMRSWGTTSRNTPPVGYRCPVRSSTITYS